MEMTRFVPARRRLTTAMAVGALALTMAGLHPPGAGAASQQPPVCQSFTVADAQGVATGPVTGEVQTAPIPGAQAGTQSGGAPQAATGQPGQPGVKDVAPNAPETVSCVIGAASVPHQVCVVTNPGTTGQAGGASAFSTEAGTNAQAEMVAGGAQPGAGLQTAPDQIPADAQVQSGGASPAGNQVLNPNEQATATAGTAGTQGEQGTQGSAGAPAGEAGTGAGGVNAAQPTQPFTGAGGGDVVISADTAGTFGSCGAGGTGDAGTGTGVGAGDLAPVVENGTATADTVPAVEQAPVSGCEEMVLSEYALPSGGTIKVSITPC